MMSNGPINSYAQLAAEAETYYRELSKRSEEYKEPFYDSYDILIEDGDWYIDTGNDILSQTTINSIYNLYCKEKKSVSDYIKAIFGIESRESTEEDRAYYEETYENGDLYALCDSITPVIRYEE